RARRRRQLLVPLALRGRRPVADGRIHSPGARGRARRRARALQSAGPARRRLRRTGTGRPGSPGGLSMRRRHAPSLALSLALSLSLAALAAPEPPDPAMDEQAGAALLAKYEQARSDGNPELAERLGNELDDLHGKTTAATTMRESIDEVRRQAEELREQRRLKELWDYQSIPVPGGTQHSAAIYSRVPPLNADSGLPPPRPDARLILRRHPDWGESAYLVLEMSELRCGPPCRLSIRFDDGEDQRFAGEPADTGTG